MKKFKESVVILLVILFLFQFESIEIKASGTAVFYVQTVAVLEDNTIEVSVYLDGVDNVGGMDIELIYDSDKVSFVDSSLGESLKSSLSDIYHDKEREKIHYVVLCSNSESVQGVLLRATFEQKEEGAYQPQLVVNELLDNSLEINEIPYETVYQQVDETWVDTQDVKIEETDNSIIKDTEEIIVETKDLVSKRFVVVGVALLSLISGITFIFYNKRRNT